MIVHVAACCPDGKCSCPCHRDPIDDPVDQPRREPLSGPMRGCAMDYAWIGDRTCPACGGNAV